MPTDTAAHSKLQKERVRGGASAEHVHASILAVAAMYKASGNAAFKDKKYAEGISYYQVSVCLFLSVCVFLNMCPPPTHTDTYTCTCAHTQLTRAHTRTHQAALSLMDTDVFKAAKGDAAAEEEAEELKTTCHCNIAVGNPKTDY